MNFLPVIRRRQHQRHQFDWCGIRAYELISYTKTNQKLSTSTSSSQSSSILLTNCLLFYCHSPLGADNNAISCLGMFTLGRRTSFWGLCFVHYYICTYIILENSLFSLVCTFILTNISVALFTDLLSLTLRRGQQRSQLFGNVRAMPATNFVLGFVFLFIYEYVCMSH